MTQDDLARLSREVLVELVLAEHAQLEALQAVNTQLKSDIEALKADNEALNLKAEVCTNCHADLHAVAGHLLEVNQITELPDPKAEVIEVRQYEVDCPHCGQAQVAQPPEGLEMERTFGARLEATVVYYRQEQTLSYKRTQ